MSKIQKYLPPYHVFLGLWKCLSKTNKKTTYIYILIVVINSFFEIVAIGSFIPFLGALIAPEKLNEIEVINIIFEKFNIKASEIMLTLTLSFCLAAVISMLTKLMVIRYGTKIAFSIGRDITYEIFNRVLHQKYIFYLNHNSSVIIDVISTKTNATISGFIMQVINLASTIILLLFILVALFIINPIISAVVFIGFGFIYLLIIFFLKDIINRNGQKTALLSAEIVREIQESVGGIRNVLMGATQDRLLNNFRDLDSELRRCQASNIAIQAYPRPVIEAMGILILIGISYIFTINNRLDFGVVPILGGYAFGIQKILPLLQQSYGAIASILGTTAMVSDVLGYLNLPIQSKYSDNSNRRIIFNNSIVFSNISFRYSHDMPWVLKNFNLTISKGDRIGIVGQTGQGKSTLLDLIMGLLNPTDGKIFVDQKIVSLDNQDWRNRIAHVPQSIYLADSTIAENIAFGVKLELIDYEKLALVSKQAKINDLIDSLPEGYNTRVGEVGIRLSGGQRQRIGIARALYRDATILIFDEGTSALDHLTGQLVMQSIYDLNSELTILIVSHRLSSLKQCSKIIDLSVGKAAIKLNLH